MKKKYTPYLVASLALIAVSLFFGDHIYQFMQGFYEGITE